MVEASWTMCFRSLVRHNSGAFMLPNEISDRASYAYVALLEKKCHSGCKRLVIGPYRGTPYDVRPAGYWAFVNQVQAWLVSLSQESSE